MGKGLLACTAGGDCVQPLGTGHDEQLECDYDGFDDDADADDDDDDGGCSGDMMSQHEGVRELGYAMGTGTQQQAGCEKLRWKLLESARQVHPACSQTAAV